MRAEKCQCVRSAGRQRCYIDILKTTEDVIFRLSLLVPATLAEFITPNAKTISNEAAAFCASTGVFLSAWQQQQVEAGFEHPNGRLAHAVLIERLKNAQKYTLTEIDEQGRERKQEYQKRRDAMKRMFQGNTPNKILK